MRPVFPSPTSDLVCRAFRMLPVVGEIACAMHGKHLLLTGGTGFFGLWILALLHELNMQGACVEVTVISRQPERFLAEQPEYRNCSWLHWLVSDVRDLKEFSRSPIDLVLHAAADTSAQAHASPLELFDSILHGARNVFDLAVCHGAKRLLLTGSGAQYGSASVFLREDSAHACDSRLPSNSYAEAKRAQETLAALYAQRYGIEVVMTRCFAFSGPGLPLGGHFAIGNFVRDALNSDAIVLNSNGTAVRSYLHGADLAIWLLTLLVRGESGQAYNVGSDQPISIADLAHRVISRVAPGKPLKILGKEGDLVRSFYVPDIGRARALGLDVWTNLDSSIDSMARWGKSY